MTYDPIDTSATDNAADGSVTTDTLDSTTVNNADTVTTQDLVVNGTATGPFGGGGVVFEEGDSITVHHGQVVTVAGDTFFDIFNLANPVDVYGGAVFGVNIPSIRVTFGTNNTTQIGNIADNAQGRDNSGNTYSVQGIFPMKNVKRLEVGNSAATQEYGFTVYTT